MFEDTVVRLPLQPMPAAKPIGLKNRETKADPHFSVFVVLSR
jgi:hypothetical protein